MRGPPPCAASYISKLIQSGHKVAVCEQVEDPKEAKGLVKREVVRIITPGLVLDSETLHSDDNNYLMGICSRGDNYGIASLDLSTGEFRVTEVTGERAMLSEGERIRPREVLFPEGIDEDDPIRKALDQWKPALVNERTKELSGTKGRGSCSFGSSRSNPWTDSGSKGSVKARKPQEPSFNTPGKPKRAPYPTSKPSAPITSTTTCFWTTGPGGTWSCSKTCGTGAAAGR